MSITRPAERMLVAAAAVATIGLLTAFEPGLLLLAACGVVGLAFALISATPGLTSAATLLLAGLLLAPVDPQLMGAAPPLGKGMLGLGLVGIALLGTRGATHWNRVPWLKSAIVLFTLSQISATLAAGAPGRSIQFLALWFTIGAVVWILASRELHQRMGPLLIWLGTVAYAVLSLTAFADGFTTRLEKGIYVHPNGFALTLLLTGIFPLWGLLTQRGVARYLFFALLLPLPATLLCTSSRGTLLAALAFYGVVAWFRLRRSITIALFLLVLGIGTLLASYAVSLSEREFNELIFNLFRKRPETGRLVMWGLLIEMAFRRPWLGYGPGGAFLELGGAALSAHNVYLQVLMDSGLVGLTSFLVLLLSAGWVAFRASNSDRNLGTLTAATFAAMTVSGIFEVSFLGNFMPGTFLFWLMVGLAASNSGANISPSERGSRS